MLKGNFFIYAPKVLLAVCWDIVYFPLWWYSIGFFRLLVGVKHFLHDQQISLGVGVWLKNIFVPMYGQRDILSRFISFFMRLFQVIFRGLGWLFWFLLSLAIIVVWLASPLLVVYGLALQFIKV